MLLRLLLCFIMLLMSMQVAVRDEYESDSDVEEEAASAQEGDENRVPNCAPAGQRLQRKGAQQQVIALGADCSDGAGQKSGAGPNDDRQMLADAEMPDELPRSSDVSEQTSCAPPEDNQQQSKLGAAPDLPAQPGAPRVGPLAVKAPRPKRVWREGTALSAGLRLMCYCARHTSLLGASTGKLRMSIVTGRPLRGVQSRNEPEAPVQRPAALAAPATAPSHPASTGPDTGAHFWLCRPICSETLLYNALASLCNSPEVKLSLLHVTPYL
jgi:hypothetical protein